MIPFIGLKIGSHTFEFEVDQEESSVEGEDATEDADNETGDQADDCEGLWKAESADCYDFGRHDESLAVL